jgi:SAM-dependent methyltransferase
VGIKPFVKSLAGAIGRMPGVSGLLRRPAVRRSLMAIPGAGRLISGAHRVPSWDRVHPFDQEHGTDTSGFVPVADLDRREQQATWAQSQPFASSQPSIIRAALRTLGALDSFTFIDLGCGKGRALVVASEFPYHEVVGVELSASLAKIARQNADLIKTRFPGRAPIRVVAGDAGQFSLPGGNIVLFLYNPFDESVVAKVARALEAALTDVRRTVYVVYYNPVAGHCFDACPVLRRHFAGTFPYAASELGYGPDAEDPVVVWHGGVVLAVNTSPANARIAIVEPRIRAKLAPA